MKILVLGCKGQLGRCLRDQFANTKYNVAFASREQIDIADFEATKNHLLAISPNIVINAAAYTAVDNAEDEKELADLINHRAVGNIALICKSLGAWLIHISTDYVFNGASNVPYKEDDRTNPQGVYGETKLNGELAIHSSDCKHIIIRTSWVFSEYGNNFLKTMLKVGLNRDSLSVVGDQIGCPTYAQDLAESIREMMPHLHSEENIGGIYHYCGDDPCSWFDLANVIFKEAKQLNYQVPLSLKSITTSEYKTQAIRPAYSVLNCSKIKTNFGINVSDWKLGVNRAVSKFNFSNLSRIS